MKQNELESLQQQQQNSLLNQLAAIQDCKYPFLDAEFPFLPKKTQTKRYFEFLLCPLKNQGYQLMSGLTPEFDTVNKVISQKIKDNFVNLQQQLANSELNKLKIETSILNKIAKYDPEIVFLGTGCMKPSRYRTVSGIYIRNPVDNTGIMLDCGEGTYYQMLNQFGEEKTQEYLADLKLIIISHQHSDHQYGMPYILQKRKEALQNRARQQQQKQKNQQQYSQQQADLQNQKNSEKLFIVIPFVIYELINSINIYLDDLNCKIIFSQELSETNFMKFVQNHFLSAFIFGENPKVLNDFIDQREDNMVQFVTFLNEIGISYIKAIPVKHCLESYAMVFEHKSGVKFAFSGDCRPNEQFEQASFKADIYIHEATFGEKEKDNAVQFNHSTIYEAIQSGIRAKAWRTVLTHFSQRYDQINIEESKQEDNNQEKNEFNQYLKNNVVIAFDHFICKLSNYQDMPQITQFISELYEEDED